MKTLKINGFSLVSQLNKSDKTLFYFTASDIGHKDCWTDHRLKLDFYKAAIWQEVLLLVIFYLTLEHFTHNLWQWDNQFPSSEDSLWHLSHSVELKPAKSLAPEELLINGTLRALWYWRSLICGLIGHTVGRCQGLSVLLRCPRPNVCAGSQVLSTPLEN